MIKQKSAYLWFKLNGILRQLIVRGLCRGFANHIVVNEYPKSGGSWLSQLLSEATGLSFPRNRLPTLNSCILQGHYLNRWNIKNPIVVWRDGRDVLVSQYYHCLFPNDRGNEYLVRKTRSILQFSDYENIGHNLPKFMEYVFERNKYPRFSWTQFVASWCERRNTIHVKYEDLRRDTVAELVRLASLLGIEQLSQERCREIVFKYSFQNVTGRRPGQEDNNTFVRKGIVGDWKNWFTRESKILFARYAGEALNRLGYENNYDWIRR